MVPFERILELWRGEFLRLPIHIPVQIFVTKYSFALSSVTKSYRKYYLENLKISQCFALRYTWAITYSRQGKPTVKSATIENFRFHDLRHSTASYLAMNGASLLEIADILGHKTLQMVKRYSHLSEDQKATVLGKMNEKIFE